MDIEREDQYIQITQCIPVPQPPMWATSPLLANDLSPPNPQTNDHTPNSSPHQAPPPPSTDHPRS